MQVDRATAILRIGQSDRENLHVVSDTHRKRIVSLPVGIFTKLLKKKKIKPQKQHKTQNTPKTKKTSFLATIASLLDRPSRSANGPCRHTRMSALVIGKREMTCPRIAQCCLGVFAGRTSLRTASEPAPIALRLALADHKKS